MSQKNKAFKSSLEIPSHHAELIRSLCEDVKKEYRKQILTMTYPDLAAILYSKLSVYVDSPPTKCDEHPKYTGKRKPRTSCEKCWNIYLSKKG